MFRRRRRVFSLTVATMLVLSAVCGAVLLTAETVRSTVLRRTSYERAVAGADAYARLYSEVLPDPAAGSVTDDLLARLPIDRSLVTANLRVVLPPAAVRGVVDSLLEEFLGYLTGTSPTLALTLDLKPVFASIAELANQYFGTQLASTQTHAATSIQQLTSQLLEAVADIARGVPPTNLPIAPLTPGQAHTVADTLLTRVPPADRAAVAPQLQVELNKGDLAGALSVIGPYVFRGTAQAISDLSRRLDHGSTLDLGVRLSAARSTPAIESLRWLHRLGPWWGWIVLTATLLAAGFFAIAAVLARVTGRRLLRWVALELFAAAAAALLGGVITRHFLVNALGSLRSSLPPAGRRLAADVTHRFVGEIQGRHLQLIAVTAVAGAVIAGLSFLARRVRLPRRAEWSRTALALTSVLMPTLLVAVGVLALPRSSDASTLSCNGFAQLCDRPYNEVTYAAAHNAMATSEDRFLGPAQDPSMVHQLDNGIRALLIDTHYWTPAAKVQPFLASLPAQTRAALAPFAAVANNHRPGTWLCHDICQLGATALSTQLHLISQWLQRNPDEIITLIVQDGISAPDTARAVKDSGLLAYIATPPTDPKARWPTLRQMIANNQRAVVFAEEDDVPGSWYRNFYKYASDTPFRNQSTSRLACQPNRGPVDAPLLLLNNWVTRAASSRRDAAVANSKQFLLNQARSCVARRARTPNYLAVDFATIGDVTAAANALNRVGS